LGRAHALPFHDDRLGKPVALKQLDAQVLDNFKLLVGFHLFEYARNFLMTCHRLLNLEYEFSRGGYLGINNHGKNVMVRVSHVGFD
jgi:hypothetical protein